MLPLAALKVNIMEQSYWLGRRRQAAAMARQADSSRARLVHLDLAGRYAIKAAVAASAPAGRQTVQAGLALSSPEEGAAFGGSAYYERLETGARWLASRAPAAERDEHLGMAVRYARLRVEAARTEGR